MNSPDEKPDTPQPQAVRRSSPLGRRKKSKPAVDADAATSSADETAVGETGIDETGIDEAGASEADADEPEIAQPGADDSDADESAGVEPDADEVARNAAYRERRRNRAVVRRTATGRKAGDRSSLTLVALALTSLLVVAGIVLSAVFGVQYYQIRKDRELRAEYSSFARQMVVSMFTLNPDNADQMYKNVMDNTSGRARQMFKDNMKNTAKMIREGDMVTKTTVLADAVSKASADEGSVLVVLDWEGYPSKDKKSAQSASFRLRVDMTRLNGALKMTYLDWVA
ncbi:hypothetical protein [Gordonia hydrophobica]|uniref:Mammalian cell entry protein n=1 Tax=Gordonia hydrophobica TaxID=40516 RepID=A0ABZ2TVJ8_9ACTN|nr:hypothetical protein [Gordonia hydrophobica]MBM7366027.1 Mce-associated membrane protein [Gordonia hydrophobica]